MPLQQITATDIQNGTITGSDIASGTITGSNLSANTISNTAFQTGSVENYMSAQGTPFGNRNRIINGAMMIDQRNAGASVSLNGTENYVIDRWIGCSYGGNSVSFARSTVVPSGSATDKAFAYSFSATNGGSTAAGTTSFYSFRQKIEGNNIYDLGLGTASAKSFTVSFWARSSVTGTYVVAVLNGAANWSNRTTYTINSANTWEYKTVTFAGTSSGSWVTDNTTGMYLDFTLSAGSNQNGASNTWISGAVESDFLATNTWCATNGATFYITGVQLEKGSVATPFENRLYGTELALCQRYYWKNLSTSAVAALGGVGAFGTATLAYIMFQYPVPMRVSPTFSYFNVNLANGATSAAVTTIGNAYLGPNGAQIAIGSTSISGVTAGMAAYIYDTANGVGYVAFSAEL